MLSPEYTFLLVIVLLALVVPKRIKPFFVIVALATMTILGMFRDITVGTDTYGYMEDFYRLHSLELGDDQIRHHWEPGFQLAILTFKQFSNSYPLFMTIIFIPYMIAFVKIVKDYKLDWPIALFLFYALGFYFIIFNIMRQMLVTAIVFAFMPLLYQRKYIKFAIVVTVTALLWHRSGLMLLFFIPLHYYIAKLKAPLDKKLLYVVALGSFSIYYIGTIFFASILSSVAFLIPQADYYQGYLMGEDMINKNYTSMAHTAFALILIYVKNPKRHQFETWVFVISVALFNITNSLSQYGSRISQTFNFMIIILVSLMLVDTQTKYRKLFFLATIVYGLAFFIYSFHIGNSGEYNPYRFLMR